jgi:hypothetical protein
VNGASSEPISTVKNCHSHYGPVAQEAYEARYAIVEFLADVHTIMPPYWYKLEGDDLGSVACLFGLSEPDLMTLAAHDGGRCVQDWQRHRNKMKQL